MRCWWGFGGLSRDIDARGSAGTIDNRGMFSYLELLTLGGGGGQEGNAITFRDIGPRVREGTIGECFFISRY